MSDKQRILVIEDDLYTRDLFKETLTDAGFEVEAIADGLEGLAKIQTGGYALIILDAMLPKIDGLTILIKSKEKPPQNPNGPIVIVTNLARDAILNQALKAGAHACLIKTDLNPDQLVQKVKEYVGKS